MFKPRIQKLRDVYLDYGPENNRKVTLIFKYDKHGKIWSFHGFRCKACNTSLKFKSGVEKHISNCKKFDPVQKKPDCTILIDDGTEWVPLKIFQ
jgi:hypothetical protein